jgi:hypothetical protein
MIRDTDSAKLYVFRGSTLPCIAVVVTSNEYSKTNLWRDRLSHMSEHSMAK